MAARYASAYAEPGLRPSSKSPMTSALRLAVVLSHPIQYYAPFFRALAERLDLHVFFGQTLTAAQQASAGFDTAFDWDVDLVSGYRSTFLNNIAARPGPVRFFGCDTPEIG